MRRSSAPRKVAILCPNSIPWVSLCIDGIRQYAREHGSWHLFSSPPTMRGTGESALTMSSMRGWKGDGVFGIFDDKAELKYAHGLGIPVVNMGGALAKSFGVPRVMVDHFKAGRMAADHFLSRGLKNLAFFGWEELWYSQQRQKGFVQRAHEAGADCKILLRASRHESNQNWAARISSLTRWLLSLPRPTGIFAVHDYRAQFLIEACQAAELRIPADIAVIGMDNTEAICEHVVPTLSSISRGSQRVGWEAAALLDRLMHGEKPPAEDTFLDPDGIVSRQSTAMQYSEDPLVQAALDYMRDHLGEPFNISSVADHTAMSKRTVEMRFRGSLGISPHVFLTKLRVQRAEALLRMPQKRSIEEVALECGFGTPATFYGAFRRLTGLSPASYRRGISRALDHGRA